MVAAMMRGGAGVLAGALVGEEVAGWVAMVLAGVGMARVCAQLRVCFEVV